MVARRTVKITAMGLATKVISLLSSESPSNVLPSELKRRLQAVSGRDVSIGNCANVLYIYN